MSPIQRIKSFDSTGIAPNGRLYAGDLNAIQDAAAGQTDASQTLLLGTLQVGDTSIQALKFGAEIMRITSHLMVDKTIHLGNLTTTARDALTSGKAPKGALLFNTTIGFPQINIGTDGARNWMTVGDINQTFMDAKGDLIVGTGSDTAARQAVGANGTTIVADSTQTTGIKWGNPVIPYVSNYLSADVTIPSDNTYTDGPSISLVAGTWAVIGSAWVQANTAGGQVNFGFKLWDGTTNYSSGNIPGDSSTQNAQVTLAAIVVLASTKTLRVACATNGAGGSRAIKAAISPNGAGNTASYIHGLRIA